MTGRRSSSPRFVRRHLLPSSSSSSSRFFFFFNDPATTEIYTVRNTLSLHDALPISRHGGIGDRPGTIVDRRGNVLGRHRGARSEEHTSELQSLRTIPYAVFCLKKKNSNKYARSKSGRTGPSAKRSPASTIPSSMFIVRIPPTWRSTRYATLFPYTTLFR